jgi:hypothetical protein
MSKSVWGPATWAMLHCLVLKIKDDATNTTQLKTLITSICDNLPCPYCASDATMFLEKININKLNTKQDFKNMIYIFHNRVNLKKRKKLLNSTELDNLYKTKNLLKVIINFIKKYHTKGNMQLLNESFHRQMVIKEFKKWLQNNKQCLNWGI